MNKEQILDAISKMSVLELVDLIKAIEEKFDVSADAQVTAVAVAGGAAPAAGVAEEKTDFTIVLTDAGDKKVNVIKVIRAHTTLGLKEAKDMADTTPAVIKEGVSKADADKMKKEFEEAGAKVELK